MCYFESPHSTTDQGRRRRLFAPFATAQLFILHLSNGAAAFVFTGPRERWPSSKTGRKFVAISDDAATLGYESENSKSKGADDGGRGGDGVLLPRLEPRTSDLLASSDLLSFERDGHLRVPSLLSPSDELPPLRSACLRSMESSRSAASLHALNMNGEDVDPPFLQHFNPWRSCPTAASYARSGRLASVAAALLNVDRVRLYQDCIFQKRPGDSPTGWHADLKMVPLDTNQYVTVWIALDDIPPFDDGGTGLHFVTGSHRDFALPFWYGEALRRGDGDEGEDEFDLSDRYAERIVEQYLPLRAGDSTWHHGWTLHYAPDLFDDEVRDRIAYTASYVADPVRTLGAEAAAGGGRAQDEEDAASYEGWIDEFGPGDLVHHECLPTVWPPECAT